MISSVLPFLFLIPVSFSQTTTLPAPTPAPAIAEPAMTKKDAKKTCKDDGKTGRDLIECVKQRSESKEQRIRRDSLFANNQAVAFLGFELAISVAIFFAASNSFVETIIEIVFFCSAAI